MQKPHARDRPFCRCTTWRLHDLKDLGRMAVSLYQAVVQYLNGWRKLSLSVEFSIVAAHSWTSARLYFAIPSDR